MPRALTASNSTATPAAPSATAVKRRAVNLSPHRQRSRGRVLDELTREPASKPSAAEEDDDPDLDTDIPF